jgi:hypothetical protein
VRQVRGLYSAVDQNQAEITARRVAVDKARDDVKRRSGLVATGAVSAEELAHARDELTAAEAALASAGENLSRNRALVDATTLEDQPQVAAAAAQVRAAYPQPAAHGDRCAGHRLRRQAQRAARPARAAGHHADDGHSARTGVGGSELQGNAARQHAHRPAGGTALGPVRQGRALRRQAREPRPGHR